MRKAWDVAFAVAFAVEEFSDSVLKLLGVEAQLSLGNNGGRIGKGSGLAGRSVDLQLRYKWNRGLDVSGTYWEPQTGSVMLCSWRSQPGLTFIKME